MKSAKVCTSKKKNMVKRRKKVPPTKKTVTTKTPSSQMAKNTQIDDDAESSYCSPKDISDSEGGSSDWKPSGVFDISGLSLLISSYFTTFHRLMNH